MSKGKSVKNYIFEIFERSEHELQGVGKYPEMRFLCEFHSKMKIFISLRPLLINVSKRGCVLTKSYEFDSLPDFEIL